jgi:ssRNA-specific RNase YbeY (16S rRNA maturation enzyme)
VPGVLHPAGHDDHEPRARRRMRIAERRALALLALPAPRGLRSS